MQMDTNAIDYDLLETIACEKAMLGHVVRILPGLDDATDPLRNTIFKGVKGNTNPDLRIDDEYVEVKQPQKGFSRNTLSNSIHSGHKQADRIIIDLPELPEIIELRNVIKGRFKIHHNLVWVEFRLKNNYLRFDNKKRRLLSHQLV